MGFALLDKRDFHALMIGLQMMFSFMLAEDKILLGMCDSCDKCPRKGE